MKIDIIEVELNEAMTQWEASFPVGDEEGDLHVFTGVGETPSECLRDLANEIERWLLRRSLKEPPAIPTAKLQ